MKQYLKKMIENIKAGRMSCEHILNCKDCPFFRRFEEYSCPTEDTILKMGELKNVNL